VLPHNRTFENSDKYAKILRIFECRVGQAPVLKMCNRPISKAKSVIRKSHFFAHFCTLPLFKSAIVRSLFLKCKKSAILKFTLFCTFAHFERAIVLSHFFHTFSKSDKKHDCTFLKSDKKCDRTLRFRAR